VKIKCPAHPVFAAITTIVSVCLWAQAPAPIPQLAIAGSPSLVEGPQFWQCGGKQREIVIIARNGKIANVDVSTTGLGDARLCAGACASCTAAKETVVRLEEVSSKGAKVCVAFPRDAFPGGAAVAKGQIVAASSGFIAESAVSLSGAPAPPVWFTAFLWGVGIAAPALLSALLALRTYRRQKAIDDELSRGRVADELLRRDLGRRGHEFFTVYLKNTLDQKDHDFTDGVREQLHDLPLKGLPRELEVAILQAMNLKKRRAILDALRAAFPDYAAEIDAARKP
jgi:hypothetical protein